MAVVAAFLDNTRPMHAQSGYYDGIVGLTFSGSYATGGDSLDLTALTKRVGGRGVNSFVLFEAPAGYHLVYDRTNKKVLVYTTAATELAAAAYPAGMTAAQIRAYVRGA